MYGDLISQPASKQDSGYVDGVEVKWGRGQEAVWIMNPLV